MLMFNLLLEKAAIKPKDVYLVRHKDTRISRETLRLRGSSPYDLWSNNRAGFELYQQLQGKDCFRNRRWVASFVVTPAGETLFVGMYTNRGPKIFPKSVRNCPVSGEAVGPKTHLFYDLVPSDRLRDFYGRIIIAWGKGYRSFVQKANSKSSGNKGIIELRAQVHEKPFPSYREFHHDISTIRTIRPSWQAPLKACGGIYLLQCKDHGKLYVGKADGTDGFWGRFCQYADNGHGGNEGMKPHRCSGYWVRILDALGTPEPSELVRLEISWKKKLGTRTWGLNKN